MTVEIFCFAAVVAAVGLLVAKESVPCLRKVVFLAGAIGIRRRKGMKHYQFMRTDQDQVVEFQLELGAVSTRRNVIVLSRKQDQRTRPSNFPTSG